MRDGKNLAVIFIALAALVNQFANVTSAASAPAITVTRVINSENSDDTNIKTNKLAETANRVDFVYSSNSFKEIEHDVLQFTGNVSNIRLSCQSTKNKTAFVGWNYHGIKEIEKMKSGDDENGYIINLSSGPPVVRMECYSLENKTITNSTWIYTGEDKPPYLYNNQKTIRASVLNRTTAFLSCLLKFPLDDNGNGKELQLFKVEERVDNDAFCLGYTPELGFLLNLTKLENYLGTYKCKVENSTPDDVVYVQFDKDAFVRVSYKGYLEQFYAESPKQHSFNCELPKEMFENDFKWYYQWKNGTHSPLNDKYVENVSSVGTFDYSQTVKVQFNYSDVAGIVCVGTAKGSGSQYNSSVLVHVKSPQKINIWKAERNGYDLTCYASGDPISWKWKKNGKYLTLSDPEDQFDLLNHYSSTLTMKSIPAADSTAVKYTCIAENFLGSENNSFSVQDSGIKYMVITAIFVAVAIIWFGLIIIFFKIKLRRRLPPRFVKWFIQGEKLEEIGELQPYASLKFNPKRCIKYKDLIFGSKIKSGNFGTVITGWLKENDSQQNHTQTPVAIKMMKYDPKASEEENIKNFCSFLAEIKKMQHMDYHRYVVSYIGAVTADVAKYNAYLVVDYCRGGDLESYLKQFNRSNNDFCFHDDIQNQHQVLQYGARPKVVLKTSHLMRWAEFIAEGMYYLSSKKLLHMDLAARNILLALPGINSDEFVIVDPADLIPKISDFGLSRYLIDLQNIYQPLDPNKKFPVRWLPLETLRELKFSTKSDVFALGVTYWEMFSLARDLPYTKEGLVQNCPIQLINFLESGRVLQQPEYAPEEMWTIMLECWQKNPADRPDFETIRDDLKDANKIIAEMQESNRRSYAIQQNAESSSTKPPYVTVGFTAESGDINLNFSADSNDGSSDGESFADNDLDFSDEGSEARDAESEIEDENGISNCEVGENVNTVQNI